MRLLLLFSILLAGGYCINFIDLVTEEWEAWKAKHRRSYTSPTEESLRMKIYMDNKARVARHNRRAANGEAAHHLKMNKYGDLLHHEFVSTLNGYRPRPNNTMLLSRSLGATFIPNAVPHPLPKSVDWRAKGAVTPVKEQGVCGACYSFSAAGALEAMNFRKTGKLVELSAQNLIDCSVSTGNQGCKGGQMDNAYEYIRDNNGIDTAIAYPYEGVQGKCRYNPRHKGASDFGYVDISTGSEEELMHAVASRGPVSLAIDASHESFQFYSNGIYREDRCSSTKLDHAMLLVGYGEEDDGRKYWLIKNSWGSTWGEEGYLKLARDENNMCGVATQASYPIV